MEKRPRPGCDVSANPSVACADAAAAPLENMSAVTAAAESP